MNADAAQGPTEPARPEADGPPTGPAEIARLLRRNAFFAGIEPPLLEHLARELTPLRLPRGAVLFRQGEPGGSAYLILSGSVDILIEIPRRQIPVAVLGRHQLIGEIGAFSDTARTATVVAREDLELLAISRETFQATARAHPQLALATIEELGRRVQNVSRPLAYLTYAAEMLEADETGDAAISQLLGDTEEAAGFTEVLRGMIRQIALKRAARQELETAAAIQTAILPSALPWPPGGGFADIAARMRPAREVGGDFYDYFLIDEHRLAFAVADVSGKGVPASLFMAVACTTLRATAPYAPSPAACLARVNALLERGNDAMMFVTLFYGVIDARTGRLVYANAGHDAPFLIGAGGRARRLGATGGMALGVMPDLAFAEGEAALDPGDTLLLFTDGITEAMDEAGRLFGESRLAEVLAGAAGLGAGALADRVVAAAAGFAGDAPQADDITCLALRYRPGMIE